VLAGTVLVLPATGAQPSAPAPTGATIVVVAPGQSLTAIAARYGTTVSALAHANGLANPNHVLAGSKLVIPPTTSSAPSGTTALAAYRAPIPAPVTSNTLPAALLASPSRLALRPVFVRWADAFGVPPDLLEAMCWWESGWQTSVVSVTGAMGIGQLEPATVSAMRTQIGIPNLNPWVASDNIEMAAGFLHDLLVSTAGNVSLALAGYYQGLTSVAQVGILPSTAQYVQGITAYRSWFS
jgi:N-acetylmuramoyl-L-alanine amidase